MTTSDHDVIKAAAEWTSTGRPCALVTVVETHGSAPRHAGAKMLVGADQTSVGTVGGGALERAALEAATTAINGGEPTLIPYKLKPDLGMACGGAATIFVEPLLPASRLYLFGAGHVGAALCPMAAATGFSVTVIDERPGFASQERLPSAAALLHSYDPASWAGLRFDDQTYCVVVTHGHATDTEVVAALLAREQRYLGMIGSTRKRSALEQTLSERGLDPQRLAALHTPIGLSIGAETPAEIAVSILAELVQARVDAGEIPDLPPTTKDVDKKRSE
jgi:xanthine dehydrogenase accessory factor